MEQHIKTRVVGIDDMLGSAAVVLYFHAPKDLA